MARKLTLEQLAELTHQELLSLGKRVDDGFKRADDRMGRGFQAITDELGRVRRTARA